MGKLTVVLLSFAVASSGCSLFAVRTAKTKYDVGCTSDLYAPALDLGLAVGNLYTAVAYDADPKLLYGLAAAAFIGSAVHGYVATANCVRTKNAAFEYQAELLERIDENLRSPSNTDKPVPRRKPAPSEGETDAPAPSVKPSDGEVRSRLD